VNGRDRFVPMVVEEPSVVAAASNAARMVRTAGGFTVEHDPPVMVAQVQLLDVPDPDEAAARIAGARAEIFALAEAEIASLCARGGGPRALETRVLSRPGDPDGGMVVVHLDIDCRDAMGANVVNSVAEAIADRLAELATARAGLRILTNLSDRRCARVRARVPLEPLGGADVADGIVAASRFAELDPYRAATHNKGIMNGVDAVLVATGNDWRGVEAGAHAYAARSGRYLPLSTWRRQGEVLEGSAGRCARTPAPDWRSSYARSAPPPSSAPSPPRPGSPPTWRPSAPSPPRGSSAGTCRYTGAPWAVPSRTWRS